MREIIGDIWEFHKQGNWIVVPTNGSLNSKGEAIMGKGLALEAKRRLPDLPQWLGLRISTEGNSVFGNSKYHLFTFPTKHDWKKMADLSLIKESAKGLAFTRIAGTIYLPRVGCGNGGLNWEDVKPVLEKYLDDRFMVTVVR